MAHVHDEDGEESSSNEEIVNTICTLTSIGEPLGFDLLKKNQDALEHEEWGRILCPGRFKSMKRYEEFIDEIYDIYKDIYPPWADDSDDDPLTWFEDMMSDLIFEHTHLQVMHYDIILKKVPKYRWMRYLEKGPAYPLILFLTEDELREYESDHKVNRFALGVGLDGMRRLLARKPPKEVINEAIFLPNIVDNYIFFKLIIAAGCKITDQVILAALSSGWQAVLECFESKDKKGNYKIAKLDKDFIIEVFNTIATGEINFELPNFVVEKLRFNIHRWKKNYNHQFFLLRCCVILRSIGYKVKVPSGSKGTPTLKVGPDAKCCICFEKLEAFFMHCPNQDDNDHHVCLGCFQSKVEANNGWQCAQCGSGHAMQIRSLSVS
jgi:hypothetical protein